MKKCLSSFVIIALYLCFSFNHAAAQKTGRFQVELDTLGKTFTLALYVPDNYDSSKSFPLITAFHGNGMAPASMRDMVYFAGSKTGAIVFCFDYNSASSADEFFARFLRSITYLKANYKYDTTRLVSVGFSLGAYYAFNISLTNTGMYDGIIGISPALSIKSLVPTSWENIASTKMAIIAGTSDEFFSGVDSLSKKIIAEGGRLKYITKEGVGHSDEVYLNSQQFVDDYTECYNFFFDSTTTVVNDPATDLSFTFGPNPATDYIFIELGSNSSDVQITIADQTGRQVYNNTFGSDCNSRVKADLGILSNGVYFITVKSGGRVYTRKFVKCN